MNISLSRLHFPVTQLGPGKRIGIWFQGCSIRCVGCVSVDTWAQDPKKDIQISEVYKLLDCWLADADGFTISGGEPFDQVPALEAVLEYMREKCDYDILVYSGYSLAEIKQKAEHLLQKIDVLITEPYNQSISQTKPLLGSDNQIMHFLTDLGKKKFTSYTENLRFERKKLDAMFDGNQVWMTGVPEQDTLQSLKKELHKHGHTLTHTQDKRVKQES